MLPRKKKITINEIDKTPKPPTPSEGVMKSYKLGRVSVPAEL